MWRGIVGPDVTIAIKAMDEGGGGGVEQQKSQGGKAKSGSGGAGDVDVRLDDSRAVVVKVEKGGNVGEGALRRVGFEIEEWVRGRMGNH